MPYTLTVGNKEDAILKDEAPSVHYTYQDTEGEVENVNNDLLLRVLSQGEKRALYLLNIIFEIESRKKLGIKTLFIIDDIADSFDYKNKYAIVEYLKEISEYNNFYSIILTHNFDFFRTVQDRIMGGSKFTNSYMALKQQEKISLINLKYNQISNPLKNWKENLDNEAILIATVTFARNIAEHIGDADSFNKFTSILHMKEETRSITIGDLEKIYKGIFKDMSSLDLEHKEKVIVDLIFEIAEQLSNTKSEVGVNLENKIVLSIAIRLNAEIYMIQQIDDEEFVKRIQSNQTAKLFAKFKSKFDDTKSIEILDRVNLMTPENIHLNSFMYEPILDISEHHLKQLYKEVSMLIAEEELTSSQSQVASTLDNKEI